MEWLILAALVGVAGGAMWTARRRKAVAEAESAQQFEQVKGVAEQDVTSFGEQLGRLQLAGSSSDAAIAQDYQRALDCYDRAGLALRQARTPQDLSGVSSALEEGRYSLACANARLNDEPLPERLPPCFFDARHGPSVRTVEWAPPGGQTREVPVCAADATRIEDGVEPAWRPVPVGAGTAPPWAAGPAYGPWFGGAYAAYSGLLPGMLIGTMLGSSMGFGGYDAGFADGFAAGDASDAGGDGGDLGGGDLGGGDFGGGDFGGGFGDFGF